MVFELPGLSIRVAEECSGIRSSLALVITGLVMSCLVLRRGWTRLTLILLIVPVAVLKNALRIVGLSWLAIHFDRDFIGPSALHKISGIPVFLTSLVILAVLTWLLRRGETWAGKSTATREYVAL